MKAQLELKSISVLPPEQAKRPPLHATWNLGDKVVIYGPSHSGRTSLLLAISGFLQPARGTVTLEDESRRRPKPREVGVGPIAGWAPLFPTLTLEEQLRFQARTHRVRQPRQRVESSLRYWGLSPYRKRRVKDVDHHLQTRTGVALATLHQPRLVLLDEPEAGLTDDQWEKLRQQLDRERERTNFLLCITSLRRDSLKEADHVIFTGNREGDEECPYG